MPWPPPSQRFRPAQRCLLSPLLSPVPSGTALSPAMGCGDAWRQAVLETLLSLWCWWGEDVFEKVMAGVWGARTHTAARSGDHHSFLCLTEAGNGMPSPQDLSREPRDGARCCCR